MQFHAKDNFTNHAELEVAAGHQTFTDQNGKMTNQNSNLIAWI
jgi:hypothetical protein